MLVVVMLILWGSLWHRVLCVLNLLHLFVKFVDNFAVPGKVSGGGGVTWCSKFTVLFDKSLALPYRLAFQAG